MKQQRRPFQRPTGGLDRSKLRREWVELEAGSVCVWELSTPEMLSFQERCQRPAIDPRGGVDERAATGWLVALSAREGEEPDSPRLWDDLSWAEVLDLRFDEVAQLVSAAKRVCGIGAAEVKAAEDFTGATGAQKPSASRSSASSTCTASPAKSNARITS